MNSTPVGVATAAHELVVPRSIPRATATAAKVSHLAGFRDSPEILRGRCDFQIGSRRLVVGAKMTENPNWNELLDLLGPIHDDVQLFARRIARSNAEGDDVFQEAVLRAARKLGTLRDRSRFKPWMYSVVVSVHRT